jgi:hypothetical protein
MVVQIIEINLWKCKKYYRNQNYYRQEILTQQKTLITRLQRQMINFKKNKKLSVLITCLGYCNINALRGIYYV